MQSVYCILSKFLFIPPAFKNSSWWVFHFASFVSLSDFSCQQIVMNHDFLLRYCSSCLAFVLEHTDYCIWEVIVLDLVTQSLFLLNDVCAHNPRVDILVGHIDTKKTVVYILTNVDDRSYIQTIANISIVMNSYKCHWGCKPTYSVQNPSKTTYKITCAYKIRNLMDTLFYVISG